MSESLEHINLVKVIYQSLSHLISDNEKVFIKVDLPEFINKPPIIYTKHKPDIYLEINNKLFIGEAKISKDIFTKHSIQQYETYLDYCDKFDGEAHFIMAIPWSDFISVKNYLKIQKKKHQFGLNIRIYNNTGQEALL